MRVVKEEVIPKCFCIFVKSVQNVKAYDIFLSRRSMLPDKKHKTQNYFTTLANKTRKGKKVKGKGRQFV